MKGLWTYFFMIIFNFSSLLLHANEQKLIIIRHGEAANNVMKVYNSNPSSSSYKSADLTEEGKKTIKQLANDLLARGFNNDNIVALISSPLPRTLQTSEILIQSGLVSKDKLLIDNRIIEMQAGELEGKPIFPYWKKAYVKEYDTESEEHIKDRVQDFYNYLLKTYPKGHIIIVTHFIPAQHLLEIITGEKGFLNPGEVKVVSLRAQF